jgi:hypothetical protein
VAPRAGPAWHDVAGTLLAEIGIVAAFAFESVLLRVLAGVAIALGLWLALNAGPPAPAGGRRPDRLFTLGLVLAILGATGTWFAWHSRPTYGPPVLAFTYAALAVAGAGLAFVRVRKLGGRGVLSQFQAEQSVTTPWEVRNPGATLTIVLATALGGLAWIALRKDQPPFAPLPGVEELPALLDGPSLAAILWLLIAALAPLLLIQAGVRSGWIHGGGQAAAWALATLALAGGMATGYFLLLAIPVPRLPERITAWEVLQAIFFVLITAFAIFRWWEDLAGPGNGRGSTERAPPP